MHSTALAGYCDIRSKGGLHAIQCALPQQLRLVTLDCPFHCWNDPNVRALFSDLVALKMLGFGNCYSANVLPVDTTDFIGRHYLSCVDTAEGTQIVAGFRAVDLERCQSFNLPFPAVSLARTAGMPVHAEAVSRFVERDSSVSYIGSWTIHPAVKRNPLLRAALREHFALGSILFHREAGVRRLILGATLRFKVDRLLSPLGYRPLAHEGKPLPPMAVQHLHGEAVRLMYFDRYSHEVLRLAEQRLRQLWDTRRTY